ncbi:MAG: hypothetical protein AB8B86_19130 [Pseudomonadales bacterium]
MVLNPARAGMVSSAREWRWSNYRATVTQVNVPPWLNVEWTLASFGRRKTKAIEAYKRFVAKGNGQPSVWSELRNQVYLGDDCFVEGLLSCIDSDEDLSEISSSQRRPTPLSLNEYKAKYPTRDKAIVLAYRRSGGYTQKAIGEHFGLHYARVSRIISKAKSET